MLCNRPKIAEVGIEDLAGRHLTLSDSCLALIVQKLGCCNRPKIAEVDIEVPAGDQSYLHHTPV